MSDWGGSGGGMSLWEWIFGPPKPPAPAPAPAPPPEPTASLGEAGLIARNFSEKILWSDMEGAREKRVKPVLLMGHIDAGGTFHTGNVGLSARTIPDQDTASPDYALTMDFPRRLNVYPSTWPDWTPTGRTLFEDKFNNTISWVQAQGTVAYSNVRPYPGCGNCMRLTTAAGAGQIAQATLQHMRLADAFGRGAGGSRQGDGPKIYYEILFKVTDTNMFSMEIGVQLADQQNLMVARLKYIPSIPDLQYFNLAGTYSTVIGGAGYATPTTEGWHRLGMELHYQSGSATLLYVKARLDDIDINMGSAATNYIRANNAGAAATNYSVMEVTATNNNAGAAEVADVGYVILKDLTNVRAILG